MKGYTSETIRNVALLGHGGCGKTTFLEAALLATGVIKKLGRVEDGNTVSDYDKMEIEKGYSINTSVVPIEWKDSKINFIDTPGYFDFVGEVNAALRAAEAAVGGCRRGCSGWYRSRLECLRTVQDTEIYRYQQER